YPGDVNPEFCVISKALSATVHPIVSSFFSLENDRIITRYKNLNPQIDVNVLRNCLEYEPKFFKWAGDYFDLSSDFFNVINSNGKRQMLIIESGSGPAGQCSMPSLDINNKRHNGYKLVIQTAFKHALKDADSSLGELAVVCDMACDEIEATGYAAAIAEETKERVWIVMLYDVAKYDQLFKWENKVMYIKDQDEAKSFEIFNTELSESGLAIRFPKTVCNISKCEIPSCIEKMGGHAVIKAPYGCCGLIIFYLQKLGQGIYIITNSEELKEFLDTNHHYEKFVIQSLVGSALWSTESCSEKLYHIGTMPNFHNQTFVNDLRMMVSADDTGFHPVNISSRRASKPQPIYQPNDSNWNPWKVFGTNVTDSSGMEEHEYERVITIDQKEFDTTGFGIDDLIDAYVQTVLSVIAIDK
ncbi:6299_t:CDS:2, partial [Racocetra fulgida]